MSTVAAVIQRGTRGAQPAATAVSIGTLYCVTDESNLVERSNGTIWQSYSASGAGSGTVTNTGTLTSGKTIIGNGSADITVSSLTAQFVGSATGTAAAASMTTARLLGRTTASSGAVEEITVGTGLSLSAGALTCSVTNKVAQIVNTETGAVATGTTQMPFDDTIPQNTEGDQYMTLTITPTNASSHLKIDVVLYVSLSISQFICSAIFQDSTANALAAFASTNGATAAAPHTYSHYMTAGTTSATTFKVRAGQHAGGTVTFNGISGTRAFGGVMASSITITEYLP